MIHYNKFTLDNGLKVLVHEDKSTPMAVVNILYNVGAKDESPEKTGFAHLFEHLMFGGSVNIPDYDEPLQRAGGENNAYTTNDLTNYYCSLPAENIETAFWLESDRMLSLAFSPDSLEVQRKVVCEEFKENYINKPYGDVGRIVRENAYHTHPYQWLTIGKKLAHIEEATLEDVKSFFYSHYLPNNAILVVAGNVETDKVKKLAEKWFGPIPAGKIAPRSYLSEPIQTTERKIVETRNVPVNLLHKAYHMGGRMDASYHATDLLAEILGDGKSSRLYQSLVKEQKLFSTLSCYHWGSVDPGLLSIAGRVQENINVEDAEKALQIEIAKIQQEGVTEKELQKVINRTESIIVFEDLSLMNRANNLAYYELLGDPELMNQEMNKYREVTRQDIQAASHSVLSEQNCTTLYYLAQNAN